MRFSKQDVAAAAVGRWREIILGLCAGLSPDCLDGRHQSCPRCGGSDRFRVFNDFDSAGGAVCNQCFSDRNADGFSFLQWWNNWGFGQSLRAVAEFLKIQPSDGSPMRPVGGKSGSPVAKQPHPQATLADRWREWDTNEEQRQHIFGEFAASRPPITAAAVASSGAAIGNWPANMDRQCVLGWWGYRGEDRVALLLIRSDGQKFPAFAKLKERKTHLVGGSASSWIHLGGRARTEAASVVWRVEGVPDGIALLSLLPTHHAVVTPSTGCAWNSNRKDRNPPLDIFTGKVLIGVGDCDEPGQKGLIRFLDDAIAHASITYQCRLPYEIGKDHGKDLRDYIGEGATFADLQGRLIDHAESIRSRGEIFGGASDEVIGGKLANYELQGKQFIPRTIDAVVGDLQAMAGQWPRRCGNRLFVHEGDELQWINNPSSLFAWFGHRTKAQVDFARDGGVFSKSEVFECLAQVSAWYKSIEHVPHEPPIPDHYYACGEFPDSDGSHLAWLLDRFSPATEIDRSLILVMLATAFWGGAGGARPAFLITADGRGAGKTTLAAICAELTGGMIDISPKEDIAKIKERILTAEGKDKRVVLIDNIKAVRFSSAELEALTTAQVISGRELYHGESQRPNTLLWLMTMNGVGLSRDIAQRVVIVRLTRPQYSGAWSDETMAYVREHKKELICDLLTFLRGPKVRLEKYSRWGQWEDQVLARLNFPAAAQALILERQAESDIDTDESGMIEDYFREQLRMYRYEVESDCVFIPGRIANKWFREATGDRATVTKSTQAIRQQIEEGTVKSLRLARRCDLGRGFLWQVPGGEFDASEVHSDLEQRIEISERTAHRFGPAEEA